MNRSLPLDEPSDRCDELNTGNEGSAHLGEVNVSADAADETGAFGATDPFPQTHQTNIGADPSAKSDPVWDFFARYPSFVHDPTFPPARLFAQLTKHNGWSIGSSKFEIALSQLNIALFQRLHPDVEMIYPDLVEPGPDFVKPSPDPVSEPKPPLDAGSGQGAGSEMTGNRAGQVLGSDEWIDSALSSLWNTLDDVRDSTSPALQSIRNAQPEARYEVKAPKPQEQRQSEPTAEREQPLEDKSCAESNMMDPIQEYFERYPGYEYDPFISPARQFDRLVEYNRWPLGSPRFHMALLQVQAALFRQFDRSIEIRGPFIVEPEPEPEPEPGSSSQCGGVEAVCDGTGRKPGAGKKNLARVSSPVVRSYLGPPLREVADYGLRRVTDDAPAPCQTRRQVGPLLPIDAFFSEYPDFDHKRDRTQSVATQLKQLRQREKWWGRRQHVWTTVYPKYAEALVLQFNAMYGTDSEDLETWHRILEVVAAETPETVDACQSLAGSMYVNLVDLVDAGLNPETIPVVSTFESQEALSRYTIGTKRYFPQEYGAAGSLLKIFLRRVF
ncbi:hypothetical protein NP233_g1919 [Leucocoprinus birnbaumii]|uniref:Uncharacterized protein n=1 Tax=Leucocoprinus birnbaumii TaxID=56174 RepID=A0AAD5W2A5_9AGAR|nr:hypothetical protein NP233_g1919 [Leucocoprinus birnbaumii]